MRDLPESDWRVFRKLREAALERFCERVLGELRERVGQAPPSFHERYLEVFELVEQGNEELSRTFDNPRRSTAILQLASIRALGLLTEEEFARFSAATRTAAEALAVSRGRA